MPLLPILWTAENNDSASKLLGMREMKIPMKYYFVPISKSQKKWRIRISEYMGKLEPPGASSKNVNWSIFLRILLTVLNEIIFPKSQKSCHVV